MRPNQLKLACESKVRVWWSMWCYEWCIYNSNIYNSKVDTCVCEGQLERIENSLTNSTLFNQRHWPLLQRNTSLPHVFKWFEQHKTGWGFPSFQGWPWLFFYSLHHSCFGDEISLRLCLDGLKFYKVFFDCLLKKTSTTSLFETEEILVAKVFYSPS